MPKPHSSAYRNPLTAFQTKWTLRMSLTPLHWCTLSHEKKNHCFLSIEFNSHALNFYSEQGHSIFHKKILSAVWRQLYAWLSHSFHSLGYFNHSVPGPLTHTCDSLLACLRLSHCQFSWQWTQSGFYTLDLIRDRFSTWQFSRNIKIDISLWKAW